MKHVLVLQHIWGDTPGSLSEMMRARDIPFDCCVPWEWELFGLLTPGVSIHSRGDQSGSYWKEDTTQDDSAIQTISFWHIFA